MRRGGWWKRLYENSLGIVLIALFALTLASHFFASLRAHNAAALRHGGAPEPASAYVFDPQFWFEALQNWQSGFFGVFAMVVLTIWLRQKHSPQSKQVEAPDAKTGH